MGSGGAFGGPSGGLGGPGGGCLFNSSSSGFATTLTTTWTATARITQTTTRPPKAPPEPTESLLTEGLVTTKTCLKRFKNEIVVICWGVSIKMLVSIFFFEGLRVWRPWGGLEDSCPPMFVPITRHGHELWSKNKKFND